MLAGKPGLGAMAITYHVRICSEDDASGVSRTWQPTFAETPRVGEFVAFSRDGKRDGDGVLHMETFRVTQVLHSAGNERREPTVFLDVVAIVPAAPKGRKRPQK
jgi:hypothetical protein